jgi:hypothetical protein
MLYSRRKILNRIVDHWFEQGHWGMGYLVDQLKKMGVDEMDQITLPSKRDRQGEQIPQSVAFLITLIDELKNQKMSSTEVEKGIYGYQEFLNGCPLAMIIQGTAGATCLSHSMPKIKGGITQQQLIEARRNGLIFQLLLNRQLTNYNSEDILANSKSLALTENPADSHFLIGHERPPFGWNYNPFSDCKFAIIHGNVPSAFGVAMIENGAPTMVDIPVAGTPAAAAV